MKLRSVSNTVTPLCTDYTFSFVCMALTYLSNNFQSVFNLVFLNFFEFGRKCFYQKLLIDNFNYLNVEL